MGIFHSSTGCTKGDHTATKEKAADVPAVGARSQVLIAPEDWRRGMVAPSTDSTG